MSDDDNELTSVTGLSIDEGRMRSRLHVLDGYVRAFGHLEEIGRAVRACPSRPDAVEVLSAPPFSFSAAQVHHVLDLTFAQQTEENRRTLTAERDGLRQEIGDR